MMTTTTLSQLIEKAGDMRVMPTVARRVMELMDDENSTSASVGEAMSKDQSLAAHILKVANSALFGLSREITNMTMAVSVLGRNNIRNAIMLLTARAAYKRFGITEKMLWTHSVTCAVAARLVADRYAREVTDDAFVCGLLHDVGKVILNNECPEQFAEVMMQTYNDDASFIEAEQRVFGFTHTEVGALVTEKWNYPSVISHSIRYHHCQEEALPEPADEVTYKVTNAVDLANSICKVLGAGYRVPKPDLPLQERPSFLSFNISVDQIENLIEGCQLAFDQEASDWLG
ncbi:MAG: HDOD domain-containing protein [Acidobacteriota bacterium]